MGVVGVGVVDDSVFVGMYTFGGTEHGGATRWLLMCKVKGMVVMRNGERYKGNGEY